MCGAAGGQGTEKREPLASPPLPPLQSLWTDSFSASVLPQGLTGVTHAGEIFDRSGMWAVISVTKHKEFEQRGKITF